MFADLERYPVREPAEKLPAFLVANNGLGLVIFHGNIILSSLKSWFMRSSSFAVADL